MADNRERRVARKNLIWEANHQKWICETLRLIYDEVYKIPNNKKIVELLVDAMVMAKKMNERLVYYKNKYQDDTGNDAKNIETLQGADVRRKMRRARPL